MANIENLKPFTKDNAKEMGRRGGIASGRTRKRKALIKKQFEAYINISNYIDSLEEEEFKDFIKDYSEAEQERITSIFKPTEKQIKELLKKFR